MKIILLLIFFFTLNCSINKVSNIHGFRYLDVKYDKIHLNKSNKNDVKNLIGPPSSISSFDETWLYVERKKTNQSIFKLGKKKIESNNILLLEFSNSGLVTNKELLNLSDMNDLKIAKIKTKKKFGINNFTYDILTTLREKINAPSRNRQK